jgi:hypothetical protein
MIREYELIQQAADMPKADPLYEVEGGFPSYYSLYTPFEGANDSTDFLDLSTYNNIISAGGGIPKISTTQFAVGSSSLYLNGSSWLAVPSGPQFDFADGEFLIGYKIRFTEVNATQNMLGGNFNNGGFLLHKYGGTFYLYMNSGTSWTYSWNPVVDTWYDIKVKRTAGVVQLLIDDSIKISQAYTSNVLAYQSGNLNIGRDESNGHPCYAYIDELYIIKGQSTI